MVKVASPGRYEIARNRSLPGKRRRRRLECRHLSRKVTSPCASFPSWSVFVTEGWANPTATSSRACDNVQCNFWKKRLMFLSQEAPFHYHAYPIPSALYRNVNQYARIRPSNQPWSRSWVKYPNGVDPSAIISPWLRSSRILSMWRPAALK